VQNVVNCRNVLLKTETADEVSINRLNNDYVGLSKPYRYILLKLIGVGSWTEIKPSPRLKWPFKPDYQILCHGFKK